MLLVAQWQQLILDAEGRFPVASRLSKATVEAWPSPLPLSVPRRACPPTALVADQARALRVQFNEDANDCRRVSDFLTRRQHLDMEPSPPRAVRDPYTQISKGMRMTYRQPVEEEVGEDPQVYEELNGFRSALLPVWRFVWCEEPPIAIDSRMA